MPGQDRTGPLGQGALTGKSLGLCGAGIGFRRGFGRGFSRGFGWRYFQPVQLTKDEERKVLEAELAEIEAEKKELEKVLKELK
ncbi:MAG: DUF5320 domain-containing protein [archaeon]